MFSRQFYATRSQTVFKYAGSDRLRLARAAAYLRDNVRYGLGADEAAGLQHFLDRAAALGLGPQRDLQFF